MKSLLITGATGGLGHAVVARLARDYRCIALYRSVSSWNELRKTVAVEGVGAVEDLKEPVYGVVLLAGGFTMGSTFDDFTNMFEANLMSAVRTIEPMRSHIEDGGRVVAISSAASLTKPSGMAAYVASKAALNGYLEALSKELQPRRITVNALLPSALDTPAMRRAMSHELLVPLERVSETIAFLLHEEAQAVTGQLIVLTP